jgi:iron(III) transport system substrate-binding protein
MDVKRLAVVLLVIPLVVIALAVGKSQSAQAAQSSKAGIIEAAKKEGGLNWLDAVVVAESAEKLGEAFKKFYGLPASFKVNHERLGTGALSSRIQEEVKAGRVNVDLFGNADPALLYDLKKVNLLLQYDSPEYKNYSRARAAKLTFEPGYWQSAIAYCFAPIVNPKVFKRTITSWTDLLAPDLKGGKIDWATPAQGQSPLYAYIGMKSVLPPNFFADLAKQEPITGTGSVTQLQKLAQGEILVSMTNPFRIVQTAAQTGVELACFFPREGVPLLGHPYGMLTKSPHPNAAKLFIDWLYGDAGMKMFIDLEGIIAIRDGAVVPDRIKKFSPPLSDIKVIPMDWPSLDTATLAKARQDALQYFGK